MMIVTFDIDTGWDSVVADLTANELEALTKIMAKSRKCKRTYGDTTEVRTVVDLDTGKVRIPLCRVNIHPMAVIKPQDVEPDPENPGKFRLVEEQS